MLTDTQAIENVKDLTKNYDYFTQKWLLNVFDSDFEKEYRQSL